MATTFPPPPRIPPFDQNGQFARQWLDWFTKDLPTAIIAAATGGNVETNIDDIQTQIAMEFNNETSNMTPSTGSVSNIDDLETRIAMGTGE